MKSGGKSSNSILRSEPNGELSSAQSRIVWILAVCLLLLFALPTFAASVNSGITYHGRILKPDGSPLEGTDVKFRIQIRTPGSENCLLYEEQQTRNMAGSGGVFSITVNDGSGSRGTADEYASGQRLTLDRVFQNKPGFPTTLPNCDSGSSYSPNIADGRRFQVYFKDLTMAAWEPLPAMTVNYVPFALEAKSISGFTPQNLLRVEDASGVPAAAPAFSPTQMTELVNLIMGTSSIYARANQLGGAALPTLVGGQSLQWNGTGWSAVSTVTTEADPTVQAFAKSALPTCATGEVLKSNGTSFSCVTDVTSGAATDASTSAKGVVQISATGGINVASGVISLPDQGGITAGSTYPKVTVDAKGRVTAGAALAQSDIPSLTNTWSGTVDGSRITGTIGGSTAINTTGNLTATGLSANGLWLNGNGNQIRVAASPSLSGNIDFILPPNTGANGSILSTNGAGVLSWTAAPASSQWTTTGSDIYYNTGSVGIGVASPTVALDVNGAIKSSSAITANGNIYSGNGTAAAPSHSFALYSGSGMYYPGSNALAFSSNGAERIRIDSSGNVGIGTNNPLAPLQVVGSSGIMVDPGSPINFTTTLLNTSIRRASGGMEFRTNGSVAMQILDSGNVGIGTVTPGAPLDVKGAIRMSGATSGYTGFQPAAAAGSTVWTLPTADGSNGQVLTTNGAGILSWSTPTGGGGTVTGVTATAPLTSSGGTTPQISISQANGSTNGYLSSGDWTTFNNKLSVVAGSGLTNGNIWVGNASNQATVVAPSGDVSMTNTGNFSVTKIRGRDVASTTPVTGQVLRYNASSAWEAANFSINDLKKADGTSQFASATCTAGQTLNWSSLTDTFTCVSISIASTQVTGLGTAAAKNFGTAAGNLVELDAGAKIPASLLPASASSQWTTTGSDIYYGTGRVAIGSAAPTAGAILDLQGTGTAQSSLLLPRDNTTNRPTGVAGMIRYNTALNNIEFYDGTAWRSPPNNAVGSFSTSASASFFYTLPYASSSTGDAMPAAAASYGVHIRNNNAADSNYAPLRFNVSNGSSNGQNAVISAVAATGAGNFSPSVVFSQQTGATAYAERMRIDTTGNVGIGTTAPTAALHLKAGTTAASTAPLKFTNGSLLTTPEDGALEFDGTGLFLTTSGTRSRLANTASPTFTGNVNLSTNNSAAYVAADASNAMPLAATSGLNMNNTWGADGSGTFVKFGATNSAATNQRALIGAIATASGNTPAIVIGQQTGASTYAERMRIDTNGRVGIGTTNPNGTLELAGTGTDASLIQSVVGAGTPFIAQRLTGAGSTIVGNGDFLGEWYSAGFDGAAFRKASTIRTEVDGTPSSGSMPGRMVFLTTPSGSGTPIERMRISQSGNVGIGTTNPGAPLDVKGAIRMSGATSGYTGFQPAAAAGSTVWTLPSADGTNGQVLTTNGSGVLSWSTASGGGVTSVTAAAPLSSTGGATPQISMTQANGTTNGYLSSTDWTTFNNKLGAVAGSSLTNGSIWVGNGSNVATAAAPSGDVTMTNAGAFTVTKLQGRTVASTTPVTGQYLRYNTTNTSWEPQYFNVTDLRKSDGTSQFASATCSAGQTLNWSSLTDTFTCVNISIASTQVTGLGTAAAKNFGTAAGNLVELDAGGKVPSALLPTGAGSQWTTNSSNIYFNTGNVGIGTTTPITKLQVVNSSGGAPDNAWHSGDAVLIQDDATASSSVYVDLVAGSSGKAQMTMGTRAGGAPGAIGYELANNALYFHTNATERMRITSGGNVGIGATTPGEKLHIGGSQPTLLIRDTRTSQDSDSGGVLALSQNPGGVSIGPGVRLGAVNFEGTNNANAREVGASIESYTSGGWGALGWSNAELRFNVNNGSGSGVFEVLRLGNNGRATIFAENANTSYPTPGLTKGALHISSLDGTNGYSSAITFGANDNGAINPDAQAGMFVQSSSAYGTRMHLATTDNYTAGAKARMTILETGNVGIGTTTPGAPLDVRGAIRMSGSTSGYTGFRPAAAAGSTVWQLPAADGTNGQALVTNGSGVLSWATPSGSGVTSVTATAPLSSTGGTTPQISITQANGTTNGYLSSTDWTTFNNKLGTTLTNGSIWVGNGSNAATAVAPAGDVTMSNAGSFTVSKLQGRTVASTTPVTGQYLRYNTTNTSWEPQYFNVTDLRKSDGTSQFASATCTAGQTLNWSSLTDTFTCTNIAIANTQVSGLGTASTKNFGTSAGNLVELDGTGKIPSALLPSGGSGDFRANGSVAMTGNLRLGSNWLSNDGGNEGINITTNGKIGLGATHTGASLVHMGETRTDTALGWTQTLMSDTNFQPTANSDAQMISGYFATTGRGAYNLNQAIGVLGDATMAGTGTIGQLIAVQGVPFAQSGIVNQAIGFSTYLENTGASAVVEYHGVSIGAYNGAGTLENAVGVYIQDLPGSNSQYGIYQQGATDSNYFAGKVGIGVTSPLTTLDVGGYLLVRDDIETSSVDGGVLSFNRDDTTVVAGETIASITTSTEDGAVSPVGAWSVLASQAHSGTAKGTEMLFYTTPDNTTTAQERMVIHQNGYVGIGMDASAMLDVNGLIRSPAVNNNASTAINFASGNTQYTTAACSGATWTLSNLLDGASVTLVVKATTHTGPCQFSATGVTTWRYRPGNITPQSGHVVYSILRAGSDAYVTWVDGF